MIRKRTDLPGETSEPQETSQSGGPQHPPQRAPAPLQQKQYGDGSGSGGPQRPSHGELARLQQQPQIGGGGVRAWGPWVQPQPQQQLQYSGGSESGCPQRPPQRAPVSMQQQQQIGGRGVRGWGPRAQPQQRSQYGHVGGTHQRGGLVSQYQGRGGPQQQPSVNQGRDGPQQQPSQFQGRGGPQPSGNPGRGWARPPQGAWGSQPAFSGRGAGPSTASSMRPPPPNLHQAQSSFSQPSSSSTQDLSESFEKLYMQSPMPATSQAILPSSKALRFPLRPGTGTVGRKCIVKANHFIAELPDKELHQYDVSITPEVTSRGINRAVMNQLVMLHREKDLGGRLPAYDGRKSLYTAGPLPFFSHDFVITLLDEDDGSGAERRRRTFKIKINHTSQINLESLRGFLDGRQADVPQDTLQVLDIVLREGPTARKGFVPVGRSFFSADLGMKRQLGDGLESWGGFYQSIRPTQMGLSLNIDMSSCAFIEPLPVLEFVSQLLNRDITRFPLNSAESVKIKKTLRGVKVVVTHRGNMRRKYRINGLTTQPTRELTFPVDGVTTSVVQYFRETYGFPIQYINLPCLQVGNPQKPNYLPMEVCQIDEKQRYSKRLNEKQITALLKATCQHPKYRECAIKKTVETNAYNHDDHVLEFGLNISSKLAEVKARVLPAPLLKYHDSGSEKNVLPRDGQWNMRNKKLFNGARVNFWMCINFSRIQERGASKFCVELARMCNTSGMEFSLNPVLATHCAQNRSVEQVLSTQYRAAMGALQGRKLDLLIVILPDHNGSLYGDIKRICETNLGLVSQCCLNKHVLKCNPQYLANVALKINVKVGGRNTVLVDALSRNIPWVTDTTTIIFGADVSHPHPGEDSSPSIAAVVASQDWPHITKFVGRVSAQAHRQELIEDMYNVYEDPQRGVVHGGMIRELLISFMEANGGQKPQRIIFYRDGVSEGQFYQVLLHEVQAIRKACASLQYEQPPTITFVVVQKRHHTRLFAYDHADLGSVDRSGNILPGTVVDSQICHRTEFDFYLCSHAGIQGTSRPAHYHVLWDENNFTADGLQLLTNSMCYTYARCTRSVSIAPPAYYAHLAAFRARYYVQPETSGNGSTESLGPQQRATRVQSGVAVRPLPALSDDVKRVMFYC